MPSCDARMTSEGHKCFHKQQRNWSVLLKVRTIISYCAVVATYSGTAPILRAAPAPNKIYTAIQTLVHVGLLSQRARGVGCCQRDRDARAQGRFQGVAATASPLRWSPRPDNIQSCYRGAIVHGTTT